MPDKEARHTMSGDLREQLVDAVGNEYGQYDSELVDRLCSLYANRLKALKAALPEKYSTKENRWRFSAQFLVHDGVIDQVTSLIDSELKEIEG